MQLNRNRHANIFGITFLICGIIFFIVVGIATYPYEVKAKQNRGTGNVQRNQKSSGALKTKALRLLPANPDITFEQRGDVIRGLKLISNHDLGRFKSIQRRLFKWANFNFSDEESPYLYNLYISAVLTMPNREIMDLVLFYTPGSLPNIIQDVYEENKNFKENIFTDKILEQIEAINKEIKKRSNNQKENSKKGKKKKKNKAENGKVNFSAITTKRLKLIKRSYISGLSTLAQETDTKVRNLIIKKLNEKFNDPIQALRSGGNFQGIQVLDVVELIDKLNWTSQYGLLIKIKNGQLDSQIRKGSGDFFLGYIKKQAELALPPNLSEEEEREIIRDFLREQSQQ